MKAALAAIKRPDHAKRVALYYANSYTSGQGTLVDEAVRLAGLENMAGEIGITGSALRRWRNWCLKSRIFWCAVRVTARPRWHLKISSTRLCARWKSRRGP